MQQLTHAAPALARETFFFSVVVLGLGNLRGRRRRGRSRRRGRRAARATQMVIEMATARGEEEVVLAPS